jgi:uncharacterized membrane protein YphA (DoxX/SURF4 family)
MPGARKGDASHACQGSRPGMNGRLHARVTGTVRLLLAGWLMAAALGVLADPQHAVASQGLPLGVLLPVAGLNFAVGAFLLTGFMSRVAGLVLVGLGVWQLASFGVSLLPLAQTIAGVYLALRGGGAWAMDIYVQKMQDRVRQKTLIER